MKITSRENQRLKAARKLRAGKGHNLLFVEGVRLAEEALRANLKINDVFYSDEFLSCERHEKLLATLGSKCGGIFEVDWRVFDSITDTRSSQGLVLTAERPVSGPKYVEKAVLASRRPFPLVVLLHQINNPVNLGAVLRTAGAAGADGVILTRDSTDAFSPNALRGSMGAAFRVPLWEAAGLSEALGWARNCGLFAVCADIRSALSYTELDWRKPRLLVFGSEAHGLSVEERSQIDESIIVPMENGAESLNLAVSCGIILFEVKRQTDL